MVVVVVVEISTLGCDAKKLSCVQIISTFLNT